MKLLYWVKINSKVRWNETFFSVKSSQVQRGVLIRGKAYKSFTSVIQVLYFKNTDTDRSSSPKYRVWVQTIKRIPSLAPQFFSGVSVFCFRGMKSQGCIIPPLHSWLLDYPPLCHNTSHAHTPNQHVPQCFLWLSIMCIFPFLKDLGRYEVVKLQHVAGREREEDYTVNQIC
jgi:hypothetical protein